MRKLNALFWIAGLLLLTMPFTMPLLFRGNRSLFVIPRFEEQEAVILDAIERYHRDQGYPPPHLSDLVPAYLPASSLKFAGWPFQYGRKEDGTVILSSEVPTRWSPWVAKRVCRSTPSGPPACAYHIVCGPRPGATYLTEPVTVAALQRGVWALAQTDPCDPPEN